MLNYRITGPQSIERIDPLLHSLGKSYRLQFQQLDLSLTSKQLFFVWETFCEKEWKLFHHQATLLNRLSNSTVPLPALASHPTSLTLSSQIFEDKGNFAFLSRRMTVPTLESYLALTRADLLRWCQQRWVESCVEGDEGGEENEAIPLDLSQLANQSFLQEPFEWSLTAESSQSRDWWAVKASRGNGGKDVWIIHRENFSSIVPTLPPGDEYVIQRYVSNPLLWNHKKFHFRCYATVFGDLSGFLFEKGFILSASRDYENINPSVDDTQHLTNLSINKKYPGHPGQVPCWLSRECLPVRQHPFHPLPHLPQIFSQIAAIWSDLITAASPFLAQQLSPIHYEFVGLDILCDSYGRCHLLEVNRCPGLESSNNRCKAQEDELYDEMMYSFFEMLLRKHWQRDALCRDGRDPEGLDHSDPHSIPSPPSHWKCVRDASSDPLSSSDSTPKTYENLFNWKAFTKKHRSEIVV